jgi:serine/threonine protein kinase
VSSADRTAAQDTTTALRSPSARAVGVPPTGTVHGRYLVIEELGHGGMGVVVRAYDPKLQREVALKVLRQDVMADAARVRMIREARAMAKLNHPNVVAIYDVSLDDGLIALAMEYVPGPTLRTWLTETHRPVADIVAAFVQAGRGLAAAHAEGLLHRDFKPANALVQTDARGDDPRDARVVDHLRVKVTDFGIARLDTVPDPPPVDDDEVADLLSRSDDTGTGALTELGTVMGTPRYMAPEQHAGGPLGPATDQYAFCISLWEALTGELPFVDDLAHRKALGPPPWPRGASAPAGVVAALRRGLAARPEDRFPDMHALLRALVAHTERGRSRATVALGARSRSSSPVGRCGASPALAGAPVPRRSSPTCGVRSGAKPWSRRSCTRTHPTRLRSGSASVHASMPTPMRGSACTPTHATRRACVASSRRPCWT